MSRIRQMITILGPTATGKTKLAVELARRLEGEIISGDSRQVYRGMDIGTGKDLEEYSKGGEPVPYHMIDIVSPGYEFNVFEFQKGFHEAFHDIRKRSRVPILCGGTGMYIEAVLLGYELAEAALDPELRRELESRSDEELLAELSRLRPLHNTTDIRDRSRLIRAVEIARAKAGTEGTSGIASAVFGLHTDRGVLRQRISRRLRERLEGGLVEEIEGLLRRGLRPDQLEFYGLEYRYVTRYVLGTLNRNDMLQKLASAIFDFAKRQEKWFRRMERKGVAIIWLDAEEPGEALVDEIMAHVTAESEGASY